MIDCKTSITYVHLIIMVGYETFDTEVDITGLTFSVRFMSLVVHLVAPAASTLLGVHIEVLVLQSTSCTLSVKGWQIQHELITTHCICILFQLLSREI